jgi:hypothetical protein
VNGPKQVFVLMHEYTTGDYDYRETHQTVVGVYGSAEDANREIVRRCVRGHATADGTVRVNISEGTYVITPAVLYGEPAEAPALPAAAAFEDVPF